MLIQSLSRLKTVALGQLLPERCGVCGAYGSWLCERCGVALTSVEGPRCRRCWRLYGADECPRCEEYGCGCTLVRAAFVYTAGARHLVSAVKYRGLFALAAPMARLMAGRWQQLGLPATTVMAVPLHPRRERWRGFNQSGLLAHELARALELPYDRSSLRRRRFTAPQARVKDEHERHANVYGAFSCRDDAVVGARVLLVDDVTTTGATLGACAGALFEAGVEAVYGFAFAIAG